MQHIILFGLPGSGKTFTGKLFQSAFGFTYMEGDELLPLDMKTALVTNSKVSDDMRDRFMDAIRIRFQQMSKYHDHIVLSQTFLKDRHRRVFMEEFPECQFVLMEAPEVMRKERYGMVKTFTFTPEYWERMTATFEPIGIGYKRIVNDIDGPEYLEEQIKQLLKKDMK